MGKKSYSIFIPIFLFIIFDISALSLNIWISDSLTKSTTAINLAGRQRMLSQRISKALLLLHHQAKTSTAHKNTKNELRSSLNLFEQTLTAFWEGGPTLDGDHQPIVIPAIDSAKARIHLAEGRQLWRIFSPPIRHALDTKPPSTETYAQALLITQKHNIDLLNIMNQLTLSIEQQATENIELLRLIQSSLLICALFNFIYIIRRLVGNTKLANANNQALNSLFDSIESSIIIYDKKGGILFSNQAANELFKYHDGIPVNITITDILKLTSANQIGYCRTGVTFQARAECQKIMFKNTQSIICTIYDITQQAEKEAKLTKLAFNDPLTGLANRLLFHERLQQEIRHSKRQFSCLAVLFIDLDGFKDINDQLGHDAGDQVLKSVGQRLLQCCREDDTVARMGGDEFTLILTSINHAKAAEKVARQILTQLHKSLLIQGQAVQISASIGISLYPKDHEEADLLIKYADMAMYAAKKAGKNRYALATNLLAKEQGNTS